MSAGGKALQEMGMHPIEVAFIRNLLALILVTLLIVGRRQTKLFKTSMIKGQLSRGLIGNISLIIAFWAVSLLPMAQVTAIGFTMPLFTIIMSMIFLKETIGPWRIFALAAGFISVLLIAQPAIETNNTLGLGVALFSAFLIACTSINLRFLGKNKEPALTTVFYFLAFGVVFDSLLLPTIWTGTLLSHEAFALIGITAFVGFLSQIVKTEAYANAEASLLSPILYLNIVWATLADWIFWHDLPPVTVILGCTLLVLSNMVILWREYSHEKSAKDKI